MEKSHLLKKKIDRKIQSPAADQSSLNWECFVSKTNTTYLTETPAPSLSLSLCRTCSPHVGKRHRHTPHIRVQWIRWGCGAHQCMEVRLSALSWIQNGQNKKVLCGCICWMEKFDVSKLPPLFLVVNEKQPNTQREHPLCSSSTRELLGPVIYLFSPLTLTRFTLGETYHRNFTYRDSPKSFPTGPRRIKKVFPVVLLVWSVTLLRHFVHFTW